MEKIHSLILIRGAKLSQKFRSRFLLTAIFVLFFQYTSCAAEANGTATITVFKLEKLYEIAVGAMPEIYIDGLLDHSTLDKLEYATSDHNISGGAMVFLNSPGGQLTAGIDIGRFIRAHGWSTYVGTRGEEYGKAQSGRCYSACVFAYIGGYYRFSSRGSLLGVHRFSKAKSERDDIDIAQVISALLTNYIKEMGVDNGLFERMVQAGSDELIILSDDDTKRFGVINDGVLPAHWSFENMDQYIYLTGQQETLYGIGKLIFVCHNHSLSATAIYEAGENATLILRSTNNYSLRIDDEFIPVKIDDRPQIVNKNFIYATFILTQDQLQQISTAHKLGFAFRPGNPDLFYGFIIEVDGGHSKIISMIKSCAM